MWGIIICDKVCQWLVAGQWFSQGITVSSTDEIDCHNIAEILLKMALNSIAITLCQSLVKYSYKYKSFLQEKNMLMVLKAIVPIESNIWPALKPETCHVSLIFYFQAFVTNCNWRSTEQKSVPFSLWRLAWTRKWEYKSYFIMIICIWNNKIWKWAPSKSKSRPT